MSGSDYFNSTQAMRVRYEMRIGLTATSPNVHVQLVNLTDYPSPPLTLYGMDAVRYILRAVVRAVRRLTARA